MTTNTAREENATLDSRDPKLMRTRLRKFMEENFGSWTAKEIERLAVFIDGEVRSGVVSETPAAGSAKKGARKLPEVGDVIRRAHLKTGFGLYLDKVAEHSPDGKSFRCHSSNDVWYTLENEWTGPFDQKRPFGKVWCRDLLDSIGANR